METELLKPVVKVGNSAGVILPREWLNGEAKVVLLRKPVEPEKEIFQILKDYLSDILALAIVGSYARGEQTAKSDIDILGITNKTNTMLNIEKYEIILISEKNLNESLKKMALPLIPMLKEAKALINKDMIEKYSLTELNSENLKYTLELIESALNVNKSLIELTKKTGEKCGDAVAYSLILRLRELYIISSLLNDKKWSNKELLRLIKKVSGNLNAYEGYVRVKNNQKNKDKLSVKDAELIYSFITDKLQEVKKWLIKRK